MTTCSKKTLSGLFQEVHRTPAHDKRLMIKGLKHRLNGILIELSSCNLCIYS